MRGRIDQLGTALLVVLLTACGSADHDEPTARSSGTDQVSANAPLVPSATDDSPTSLSGAATRSPGTWPSPADTGRAPAVPPPTNAGPCRIGNLAVRVMRQANTATGGPATALIILTNDGTHRCTLSGWPAIDLTRDGRRLGVPTTNVTKLRPPVGLVLPAKRSAFAGIRWQPCSPTAIGCRVGDGLRVAVPGSDLAPARLVGFTAAELTQLSMRTLEIGSINPTTDVFNW